MTLFQVVSKTYETLKSNKQAFLKMVVIYGYTLKYYGSLVQMAMIYS